MSSDPESWVYGDVAPDPEARDLIGLKTRWIVEQLPPETSSVLDYGSGEGKYLQLIRKVRPQARRVGVDVRDPHRAVDFEFHRVDANAPLPIDTGTFDAVISCDVLEHVDSIERSLDEIRRVLRPAGSFIGFVPMEGGPGAHGFFRLLDKNIYRDTKDHNHAYTHRRAPILARIALPYRAARVQLPRSGWNAGCVVLREFQGTRHWAPHGGVLARPGKPLLPGRVPCSKAVPGEPAGQICQPPRVS